MKTYKYITLLAIVLCACSCKYKELCMDHRHVVDLDMKIMWQRGDDPDAESMTTYYYDLDNGTALRFDMPGKDGGTARLPIGRYNSLTVNACNHCVAFRGCECCDDFEAYTREISLQEGTQILSKATMPKAAGTEDQKVIMEPERLWSAMGEEFNLTDGMKHAEVVVKMERRTARITVLIENVPNMEYSREFGASLSGLAGSVFVKDGRKGNEKVMESFPLDAIADGTLQGQVNAFGDYWACGCPHILTVYAALADGTGWYYPIDITDQMEDPELNPDPYELFIYIKDLPVPKPIINDSGFIPEVDSWQGIDIPVTM